MANQEIKEILDNIETYGVSTGSGENRHKLLTEDVGFRTGEKADYVFITSCRFPTHLPNTFQALKQIFHHFQIDYTLLPEEYCCGAEPLLQPAIKSRDAERLKSTMELCQDLILKNVKQAEALGAKYIVTFCTGCNLIYTSLKPRINQEVLFYTELIDRYFTGGKLNLKADYFAGCYRGRRILKLDPINLGSALSVLNKIEGLELNHLNNTLCCMRPNELNELSASARTDTIINICTGCYWSMCNSPSRSDTTKLLMLPDVVWASLQN